MNPSKFLNYICLVLFVSLLLGCVPPQNVPTDSGLKLDTLPPFSAPDTQPEPTRPTALPTQPTEPTRNPEIRVSTQEELRELSCGDGLLEGDMIHIIADMQITEQITFQIPVSISVEASVACTYPIAFQTLRSGMIHVSVLPDVDIRELKFSFDAPNCDLVLENYDPFASELRAAELTNVNTYNGIDLKEKYGYGGQGQRCIVSFAMTQTDNPALTADLVWSVEGNVIYLPVSYLVDNAVLENAAVQICFDDGSCITEELDLLPGEGRYCVTDESGMERCYKLVTQRITYNLPVFYIEIEDGKEVTSREVYLNATIAIDTSNAYGNLPPMETTDVLIRGRGHYSWKFDKTPYKLRFEKKTSVLGLNASKNWVLLANYVDRSLIQNYLAMEMGKVMTNIPYHSNQYPVDVFVNGTYRGVYTFGEQLEVKKERIELDESYTDPDTDYLLEVGGYDEGDVYLRDYFHAGTLDYISVKHPDSQRLSKEQLDYLISYVQAADQAVCNLEDYEDYIDVDSLIDWVILHELTYNLDCCFRRSCYLIKEKGGKLKMGPIWDFDLAFGSFYRYKEGDWATIGKEGEYVEVTWMNYLITDEAFMARFTARWNEIKEPLLEKALSSVDYMSAQVAPSADMNFEVWDILGEKIPSQSAAHNKYDTYEKMVQRLKKFLQDRYDWMDSQLNG